MRPISVAIAWRIFWEDAPVPGMRVWKFNVLLVLHEMVSLSHNADLLHCHKISHFPPCYLMTHHVVASLYVILCHDMSCSTLRLTSSCLMCHLLCYVVSLVHSKLFKDAVFFGSSRELKCYYKLSQPYFTESDLETIKRNLPSR